MSSAFRLWPELLVELRACCRLLMDPVCQAHLAMTCKEEDDVRWTLYLTRFSGSRSWRTYALALTKYGSDEAVRELLRTCSECDILRRVLHHGRDGLFLSTRQPRAIFSVGLWEAFNSRQAAIEWATPWASIWSIKNTLEKVREHWDVIENIPDAPIPDISPYANHGLPAWAERHHDAILLARLRFAMKREYVAFGGTVTVAWLETLKRQDWKVLLVVEQATPFSVLQYAKCNGFNIQWDETAYDDLDVMAAYYANATYSLARPEGVRLTVVMYTMPPGYWPRYFQRFGLPWEAPLLCAAVSNRDYALITWLLARPCSGAEDCPQIPLYEGRLRQQLIKDGWFADGKFVNKMTGEILPFVLR